MHYNGVNSYIIVTVIEICKFKAKDSKINAAPRCLGNVSKVNNMKKTRLYGYVYDFLVDFDGIDVDDNWISINI